MATASEKELAAAAAELTAATATPVAEETPSEDESLVKSLVDVIDRLTKGDFGNPASAHNGNKLNHSMPMGGGEVSSGYASTSEEENVDNAGERVAASKNKAKSSTPATPKTLTKGDVTDNDDDDDEDDDKKKDDDKKPFFARDDDAEDADDKNDAKKSQDGISEDRIYKGLAEGNGAEDYIPIAEASDAIAHQTDTLAKAMAWISDQIVALSEEVHSRLDSVEKSQATEREALTGLVKSAKRALEAPLAKSEAAKTKTAPANGVVIVATGDAAPATEGVTDKGTLFKSISKAMNAGSLNTEVGANVLRRLDTQDPKAVWETLPQSTRDAILGTTETK